MSEKTKIGWCDSTLNFWRGCDKVSAGCANCYITDTMPFRTTGQKHGDPRVWSSTAIETAFRLNEQPWICDECGTAHAVNGQICMKSGCQCETRHRRRIFSLSLGDWLDDKVPIDWLAKMLDVIRCCDQVTWILCSKRLENFYPRLDQAWDWAMKKQQEPISNPARRNAALAAWIYFWKSGEPPKNVVLLASVEDQRAAEIRIGQLLNIPAACRGLSLEPLLGPITFKACTIYNWLSNSPKLDWFIIGGESGNHARPCHVEWIDELVRYCQSIRIAVFVKQLGKVSVSHNINMFDLPDGLDLEPYGTEVSGCRLLTEAKKGEDINEFPDQLKIRQWPEGF